MTGLPPTDQNFEGLRPYQGVCVHNVFSHWREGKRSVLISVPTGGGKTHIMGAVVRHVVPPTLAHADVSRRNRALILVHRDELLRQAKAKIGGIAECPIGEISAEKKEYDKPVIVAMVDSLKGRLSDLVASFSEYGPVTHVLTDEAHHAWAKTWRDIYRVIHDANGGNWYHLGVTATPMRLRGSESLSEIFPHVAFAVSIFDLISEGYLVPFKGITVEVESLEEVAKLPSAQNADGDLKDAELDQALSKNLPFLMSVVNAFIRYASGRKVVVFCAGTQEAEVLARLFRARRIKAASVHGGMDVKERRRIIQAFANDKVQVLCNCMVLTEGFDETSVDAVFIARPTRSLGLYIQMIGRGLRLHEGKKDCLIVDFCGVSKSEGMSFRTLSDVLGFYGFKMAARVLEKQAKKGRGAKKVAEERALEDMERRNSGAGGDGVDESEQGSMEDVGSVVVVDKEKIGVYQQMEEAYKDIAAEAGDFEFKDEKDPLLEQVSEGLEEFGQMLVADEMEDARSLQLYPWFLHAGIESVVFRPGYSILILPFGYGSEEEIAAAKGKLKVMPYVVYHGDKRHADNQWYAKLFKKPVSRMTGRALANSFIRTFGRPETVSPNANWRLDDPTPDDLRLGYVLAARTRGLFPIAVPFRERAAFRGVAWDMTMTMICIEIVRGGVGKERDIEDAGDDLASELLQDVDGIANRDEIEEVSDAHGWRIAPNSHNKSEVRKILFVLERVADYEELRAFKQCTFRLCNASLSVNRTHPQPESEDDNPLPWPYKLRQRLESAAKKSANIVHPGCAVAVFDNEDVRKSYAERNYHRWSRRFGEALSEYMR